jgi:hypothetical protein
MVYLTGDAEWWLHSNAVYSKLSELVWLAFFGKGEWVKMVDVLVVHEKYNPEEC